MTVPRSRFSSRFGRDEEPGVGIHAGVLICDLIFEGFCEGGLVRDNRKVLLRSTCGKCEKLLTFFTSKYTKVWLGI